MKKLIVLSSLIVMGCHLDSAPTGPIFPPIINDGISMGAKSMSTVITSTSQTITTGMLTVTLAVTPGAMYSLQLTNIQGDVINNEGFTATTTTITKTINYSAIANGAYDLHLMDTSGVVSKVPVIIQR